MKNEDRIKATAQLTVDNASKLEPVTVLSASWGSLTQLVQAQAELKWALAILKAINEGYLDSLVEQMREDLISNRYNASSSNAMSNAMESIERQVVSQLVRKFAYFN